jgi:hypothetical protein
MADPNTNFGILASTTLNEMSPKLADNVTSNIGLLAGLKQKGSIQLYDGGLKIVEPLMYALGKLQSIAAGYQTVDLTPVGGISAAEYTMTTQVVPITISQLEENQNKGRSKIIDLLDAKIRQAQLTMEEGIEQMLFGDGLGAGESLGLQALIEVDTAVTTPGGAPTASGSGTVGNITRNATNAWWKNWCGYGTHTGTAGDNLLSSMRRMILKTNRGTNKVDFLVTTSAVYDLYEALSYGKLQLIDTKMSDLGFQNIAFHGMPMIWSDYQGSALLHYINRQFLKLRIDKDMNFKTTPFASLEPKQLAKAALVEVGLQLTLNNSARQGVTYAID